jgi:hypothetical protein
MTIAEYVAEHDDLAEGHRLWPHVEGWAEELGLTGLEAVSRVRELSQQEMGQ